MTKKHSATTVSLQTHCIKRITAIKCNCIFIILLNSIFNYVYVRLMFYFFDLSLRHNSYPSVYSACKSPRYASHLFPITLPHVKHRIGIIIFRLFYIAISIDLNLILNTVYIWRGLFLISKSWMNVHQGFYWLNYCARNTHNVSYKKRM